MKNWDEIINQLNSLKIWSLAGIAGGITLVGFEMIAEIKPKNGGRK